MRMKTAQHPNRLCDQLINSSFLRTELEKFYIDLYRLTATGKLSEKLRAIYEIA